MFALPFLRRKIDRAGKTRDEALSAYKAAKERGDTRGMHAAQKRLQRATTAALRAEVRG